MLAVVGTIPEDGFPLVAGRVCLEKDRIHVGERWVEVNRGTPALLAAAIKTGEVLGLPFPCGYLAGDIGHGDGSRRLYEHLVKILPDSSFSVVAFHYLHPDVDRHNKVLFAVEEMSPRPILIADAGFMYAAKMSGQSGAYELFTPDAGELAFLADEEAPHPFYTRGFILHDENRIPDLISRAYEHKNAARYLLVKGSQDHVASGEQVHAVIDNPADEALEAIGGTGDTLTGIVSALIASGMETLEAAILAARINRQAGHYTAPNPSSKVVDLIEQIPKAMKEVWKKKDKPHGSRQAQ
ncbi:MAG: NAD(P)H-hydrate dehydratase [Desulfobacteraceae bacterium]|jgi:NAD(P)H-hydrate repair Nnr-like enzyme with NAD(P)H-hydrate dehydratase domain